MQSNAAKRMTDSSREPGIGSPAERQAKASADDVGNEPTFIPKMSLKVASKTQ